MCTKFGPPEFNDLDERKEELLNILKDIYYNGPVRVRFPDLYQYRPWNYHTCSQLQGEYIWCAKASEFNDPFDSILGLPILWEIIEKFHFAEKIPIKEENVLDLYKKINEYRYYMRVSCLTSEYDNLLMWSHYADRHKGICIGFDKDRLDEPKGKFSISPVIYTDDFLKLKNCIEYYRAENDIIRFHMDAKPASILTVIKGKNWKYENEYRVFADEQNFDNNKYSISWPIKAVYLGLSIEEKVKDEVLDIAQKKNFSIFQAVPSENFLGIKFKEID